MTVKEYFKEKDINPDDLWQIRKDQDGEWWQSIDVEHMLGEFALLIAREAVEEEKKEINSLRVSDRWIFGMSKRLHNILSRIESKLKGDL